ncbi:MAG TPA: hypothetical protein VIQ01_10530 [Burkholderiales bacterium]
MSYWKAGLLAVLATAFLSGCIVFPHGHGHGHDGHDRYERHDYGDRHDYRGDHGHRDYR